MPILTHPVLPNNTWGMELKLSCSGSARRADGHDHQAAVAEHCAWHACSKAHTLVPKVVFSSCRRPSWILTWTRSLHRACAGTVWQLTEQNHCQDTVLHSFQDEIRQTPGSTGSVSSVEVLRLRKAQGAVQEIAQPNEHAYLPGVSTRLSKGNSKRCDQVISCSSECLLSICMSYSFKIA